MHHYDFRFAIGKPFSRGQALAGGWVRPRPARAADHLLITVFADIWMPPIYMALDGPVPTATVELTVNYVASPDGLDPAAWFLTVFEAPVSQAGYYREEGEVWSEQGRLLARCSQLGVFI